MTTPVTFLGFDQSVSFQGFDQSVSFQGFDQSVVFEVNDQRVTLGFPIPTSGGESNTAANVGAGTGLVFRDKTGSTINLRSITGLGIPVTVNGDEIEIDATGFVDLTNNAPADVDASAAAVGVGTDGAREDHKHDVATAAAVSVGGGNAIGVSVSLARADHGHAIVEPGGPTDLTVAAIPDTFLVRRSGTTLEGVDPATVGVTDHGALTGLADDDHPQYRDGSIAWTGDIDAGGNDLVSVGLVDGVDVSVLSSAFTAHAADATIHFTEGSIDHLNIGNIGTNTHAAIDAHIADSSIHFTEASIDHGAIGGLTDDDHLQYLRLLGRVGGQTAYGGTAAGNILELQGANNSPDVGRLSINSPVEFFYNTADNTTPAEQYLLRWRPTFSTGNYVGGVLRTDQVVTVTGSTWIPGTFVDAGTTITAATPGFAAETFINYLHISRNSGNFNLPSVLGWNFGFVHERVTSGTSVATAVTGLSFSPQTRATTSGAVMTRTNQTAVTVTPTFSTVGGSTANLGTVTGIDVFPPAVALFQPQAGAEALTAQYGVRMRANTFVSSGDKAALRNEMTDAANRFVISNPGGARSNFGGGSLFDCGFVQILADNTSLSLGAAGGDVQINWNGSALEYDPLVGDDLRWSFASGVHTLQSSQFGSGANLRMGFDTAQFGSTGAIGNQHYNFTLNARTMGVAGEYSGVLLSPSANLTVPFANSSVFGWSVNALSTTLSGPGTVDTAGVLNVGGNPSHGTVNRFGTRILSNPAGGSGVNAALWVVTGNTQLGGPVTHTGATVGLYGVTPAAQSAAYTRNAAIVEDRTLLASASATTVNNNNVLAALIADLQSRGFIG